MKEARSISDGIQRVARRFACKPIECHIARFGALARNHDDCRSATVCGQLRDKVLSRRAREYHAAAGIRRDDTRSRPRPRRSEIGTTTAPARRQAKQASIQSTPLGR